MKLSAEDVKVCSEGHAITDKEVKLVEEGKVWRETCGCPVRPLVWRSFRNNLEGK